MPLIRFLPDGNVRSIWDDVYDFRAAGFTPRRASRIEVIEGGAKAGEFFVDFSLLADYTGDDRHRCCLTHTFRAYKEANAAEVVWLKENYILEGLECLLAEGSGAGSIRSG